MALNVYLKLNIPLFILNPVTVGFAVADDPVISHMLFLPYPINTLLVSSEGAKLYP